MLMAVVMVVAVAGMIPGRAPAADEWRSIKLEEWYLCAPMGNAGLKAAPMPKVPANGTEIRNFNHFFKMVQNDLSLYPMLAVVDLDAKYKGDITMNAEGESPEVSWRKVAAKKNAVDGANMVVAFWSTWVWAPSNITVRIHDASYEDEKRAADVYVTVNGAALRNERVDRDNPPVMRPVANQEIMLRKGWNHVYARHLVGWGTVQNDIAIAVSGADADKIKLSADPPQEAGRRFTVLGERSKTAGAGKDGTQAGSKADRKGRGK